MLDAMYSGLPILAFDSIENKAYTEGSASYFRNDHDIYQYLNTLGMEKMRKSVLAMKGISKKRLNWLAISIKYDSIFHETLKEQHDIVVKFQPLS